MNRYKIGISLLAAGLACWLGAADTTDTAKEADQKMNYEFEAAIPESELRERGAVEPSFAVKALFLESAARKWDMMTKDDFSEEQLRDFFCGAVLIRGPVSGNGSVTGFYNPWWDAILITQSGKSTVSVGKEDAKLRMVNDFVFLSGMTFRGEKENDLSVAEKLASPDGSPSKFALELTSRTRKKFEEMYGKMEFPLLLDHPGESSETSKKQIVACSGIRLKMTQRLLKDKVRYNDAWSVAKVLREGDRDTFDLLFPSDFGRMMSRTFCRLPKNIRADFEPYGYYPDKNGGKARVYIFINTRFPRLFAVASLGLGIDKNTFEWYDFAQSDELIEVFGMAKEEPEK